MADGLLEAARQAANEHHFEKTVALSLLSIAEDARRVADSLQIVTSPDFWLHVTVRS